MAKGTASMADTIQMAMMIAIDCQIFRCVWKGQMTPIMRSKLMVASDVTLTIITTTGGAKAELQSLYKTVYSTIGVCPRNYIKRDTDVTLFVFVFERKIMWFGQRI